MSWNDWYQWFTTPTDAERSVFRSITDTFRPINIWLDSMPPWVWYASAVSLFVLSGLATWLVPRSHYFRGAPDKAEWRDLRIWACVALIPYVVIYGLLR